MPVGALVSVVINSAAPGQLHVKVWEQPASRPDYFRLFMAALYLWRYVKAYDPAMASLNGFKPELN